jgi:hypothetical protein
MEKAWVPQIAKSKLQESYYEEKESLLNQANLRLLDCC